MDRTKRRQLMTERDAALKAGNIARFQELNREIAAMTPCPDCGTLHAVTAECHAS